MSLYMWTLCQHFSFIYGNEKTSQSFLFPLICCNCGTWFPSLGDIKFHFGNCKVLHRYMQCCHCALIFDNWHNFIAHVNAKGMTLAKPLSEHFLWTNISKWQNPLSSQNSDILHVALQHANLHTSDMHSDAYMTSIIPNTSSSTDEDI